MLLILQVRYLSIDQVLKRSQHKRRRSKGRKGVGKNVNEKSKVQEEKLSTT